MSFEVSIKLTLPKKKDVFRGKGWLDEIRRAMKTSSQKELKSLFDQTVYGWSAETKPHFSYKIETTQDYVSLTGYPDSNAKIWELVSSGSPPHDIFPKHEGGLLRFRTGYRAATSPGTLMSRRAYRSGPYVTAKGIIPHPGFEAREFPKLIEDEFIHLFADQMQDAVNKAARRD